MKLSTVKSSDKKNTYKSFVFILLLFLGSGMIAASLYRQSSPAPSEKENFDLEFPQEIFLQFFLLQKWPYLHNFYYLIF